MSQPTLTLLSSCQGLRVAAEKHPPEAGLHVSQGSKPPAHLHCPINFTYNTQMLRLNYSSFQEEGCKTSLQVQG